MKKVEMKDIVELSKIKWFVYQWSEIYWWLANTWDYGPYGSALKENIKNAWLKTFVQQRTDMVMLDAAILMNPQTWVASGHVGWFSDPLIDDKNTKERFRADKLLEWLIDELANKLWAEHRVVPYLDAKYNIANLIPESWSTEKQKEVMVWEKVCNPITWKPWDWTDIKKFNLMFKTFQWVTEDSTTEIYLRPETAQWIFVNFPNIVRTSRKKVPFWVAQVGKSFRNEITPGNFIFRTREFEQMEIEFFCEPGTDLEWHAKWRSDCMDFLTDVVGLNKDNLRYRDHDKDELSHYSNATTDIEFLYPFWWWELQWVADRTDFDLKAHMSVSKQDLSYFDPVNNKKYIPYVIEPSIWLTRLFLATMLNAYDTVDTEEWSRVVLRFKPSIAPIKIAVLPIVKKLWDEAKKIYSELSKHWMCEYDETGNVGKRYFRFDEIWTPFCIVVDDNTVNNNTVTVRDRDTGLQDTIKVSEMEEYFRKKLS